MLQSHLAWYLTAQRTTSNFMYRATCIQPCVSGKSTKDLEKDASRNILTSRDCTD